MSTRAAFLIGIGLGRLMQPAVDILTSLLTGHGLRGLFDD